MERAIYIIIILVLGGLLLNQHLGGGSCNCPDNKTQKKQPTTIPNKNVTEETQIETENETSSDNTSENQTSDQQDSNQNQQQNESDSSDDEQQLSGELKINLRSVDWSIQKGNRTTIKVENITFNINNGLKDDVKLFTTIKLKDPGNDELRVYNPIWDDVEVPLVKAGEVKNVNIEPSRKYPPNIEEGDKLGVSAVFTDLQGKINISVTGSTTVG